MLVRDDFDVLKCALCKNRPAWQAQARRYSRSHQGVTATPMTWLVGWVGWKWQEI